jgi:hypothetical protein
MPRGAKDPVRYTSNGTNCSSAAIAGVATAPAAPAAAIKAAANFRLRRFISIYLLRGVWVSKPWDTGIGPVLSRVFRMPVAALMPLLPTVIKT